MGRGAAEKYLLVRLESLRHFCDGTLTMVLLRYNGTLTTALLHSTPTMAICSKEQIPRCSDRTVFHLLDPWSTSHPGSQLISRGNAFIAAGGIFILHGGIS